MHIFKYDRFYCDLDKDEHYLPEIKEDDDYMKFINHMFCPECKVAELHRSVKKNIYLSKNSSSKHGIINNKQCTYAFEMASNTDIKNYVKSLQNKDQIKRRLNAVIRKLLGEVVCRSNKFENTDMDEENPLLIECRKNPDIIRRKCIPHVSVNNWKKGIPEDVLLILYGDVLLNNKHINNGKEQVYIWVRTLQGKFVTSFKRHESLSYIKDGKYHMAILGKCKCENGYLNLYINFPYYESVELIAIE